jgi:uncharacterized protein YndB with AHSA1/START domain
MSNGGRPQRVTRTAVVAAPPSEVFALLADPRRHTELDGSGTLHGQVTGPERLSLGAQFGMSMTWHGVPYRIHNTVVEFEEGRLIAWRHFHRHVWRWELSAVEAGTSTAETFDWGTSLFPWLLELGRYPALNARGMEQTLVRLQERFAGRAA